MELHNLQNSGLKHTTGILAGFMFFYNIGNVIQYAGVSISGPWVFIITVMALGAALDLLISVVAYIRNDRFRKTVITSQTFWLPTVFTLAFTGTYLAAHILAILVLTKANLAWWEKHKDSTDPKVDKECYECNAWIARFIVSIILQSAIALFLCAYMYRYQRASSQGSAESYQKLPQEPLMIDADQA